MLMAAGDVKILAGKLFDSYASELVVNRLITVSSDTGLIVRVEPFDDSKEGLARAGVDLEDASTIDLRRQTVLPGFVDAHVHRKCTAISRHIYNNSTRFMQYSYILTLRRAGQTKSLVRVSQNGPSVRPSMPSAP